MESIVKIAVLLFALVVLPATWYYSKKNGWFAESKRSFISDVEKTVKQKTKNDIVAGVVVLAMLLSIIILIEMGII